MALAAVTLDDKYALERGRVYLTGTQALVRLPMMQRQRDCAAGLNTGRLHLRLSRLAARRARPGAVERAAVSRAQPHPLPARRSTRSSARPRSGARSRSACSRAPNTTACSRCGTARGPGVDRCGDVLQARQRRRHGAAWRRAAARRRRPHLQILDPAAPVRIRLHGRRDPGAEPVGRAGDPRPRPPRLGDVALLRLLGRVQDDRRDGRQLGLGRRSTRSASRSCCPTISRCRRAG